MSTSHGISANSVNTRKFNPKIDTRRTYDYIIPSLPTDTLRAIDEHVDNSFDAGATRVWIDFKHSGHETLSYTIADNSVGMTDDVLETSLTFCPDDPIGHLGSDLGQFGAGGTIGSFWLAKTKKVITRGKDRKCIFGEFDCTREEGDEGRIRSATLEEIRLLDSYVGPKSSGTVMIHTNLRHKVQSKSWSDRLSRHLGHVYSRCLGSRDILIRRCRIGKEDYEATKVMPYDPICDATLQKTAIVEPYHDIFVDEKTGVEYEIDANWFNRELLKDLYEKGKDPTPTPANNRGRFKANSQFTSGLYIGRNDRFMTFATNLKHGKKLNISNHPTRNGLRVSVMFRCSPDQFENPLSPRYSVIRSSGARLPDHVLDSIADRGLQTWVSSAYNRLLAIKKLSTVEDPDSDDFLNDFNKATDRVPQLNSRKLDERGVVGPRRPGSKKGSVSPKNTVTTRRKSRFIEKRLNFVEKKLGSTYSSPRIDFNNYDPETGNPQPAINIEHPFIVNHYTSLPRAGKLALLYEWRAIATILQKYSDETSDLFADLTEFVLEWDRETCKHENLLKGRVALTSSTKSEEANNE